MVPKMNYRAIHFSCQAVSDNWKTCPFEFWMVSCLDHKAFWMDNYKKRNYICFSALGMAREIKFYNIWMFST